MSQSMDLVHDPIPRLIRRIAVPASVGMIFNTMYNIVDTYFGQFLSTEGLAALSLSFPLFFVIIAAGSGVATGATALISNALGTGDNEAAARYQAQAISFGVIASIVLTVVGLLVAESAYRFMGAEGLVLDLAMQYIRVILFGTGFFILNSIINAGLTSRGDTKSFRNVLCIGMILNIGLDPLFLFGFEPLRIPAFGAAGIALATVLIQGLSLIYMARKARQQRTCEGMGVRDYLPQGRFYREIAVQGVPASLNMMTVALGMFVINFFISRSGSTAGLAAYGVALRIEQIALLPSVGLHTAILTLVGNNFGAGKFDRIRETFRTALRYGLIVMAVSLGIVLPLAGVLMRQFTTDPEVVAIGRTYLYIEGLVYYAYVMLFGAVSFMQGLKRPMPAIYIGVYRQLVAPAAVFFLLAEVLGWGLTGIWWGIFFVTWSAAIVTNGWAWAVFRREKRRSETPAEATA
ncbi:MAG: MATE family efflux transporter [Spirochaetales bacterium]|nr:MATE family efflux transporter [Spirochaetales bacterium]